ncbi:DNA damage-binding protein 1a [Massospora cicadina]|nr:DNA damage-binding protein 1a [Massospora cicadina]
MSKTSQAQLDLRSDATKHGGYYLVTAHPPSSVAFAVTANFTGAEDTDLIVAQSTKLIIQDLTPTGVIPRLRLDVFGHVAAMIAFQPEGAAASMLFVLTEKRQFFILAYDASRNAVVTRSCGDFSIDFGSPLDTGLVARLDPGHRAIFLFLNQGTVKILPLVRREDLRGLHARPKPFRFSLPIPAPVASREYEIGDIMDPRDCLFDVLQVVDVAVLATGAPEMHEVLLAILYANNVYHRALAFYRYDPQAKRLGRLSQHDVAQLDNNASALFALQDGTVIVLAQERATLAKITGRRLTLRHIALPSLEEPICHAPLDPLRSFLLGSSRGTLQLLTAVFNSDDALPRLHLATIGTTVVASTLCYLDNRFLYIGSHYDDSQMVRLIITETPEETLSKVEVVENYPSISPILDLVAADASAQGTGHDQVITCSGGLSSGRLHVLRSGAGCHELANLEMAGISGLWALPSALAISFIHQTRVIGFGEDGALEEQELVGFRHDLPSLAVAACHGLIMQTTASGVMLVDPKAGLVDQWRPPSGRPIVAAAIAPAYAVVGLRGGLVVLLQLEVRQITKLGLVQMAHEIACLDITPVTTAYQFCAVGLWSSYEVHLLSLPGLQTLSHAVLPGEMVPLSLLQVEMGGVPRLLASMADGRVLFFRLEVSNGRLLYPGSLAPGTCPTVLVPYFSDGIQFVLTAADRSAIIYPHRDTLVYALVNGRGPANHACLLQGGEYDGAMAFADHQGVAVVQVAHVQRLHIRSIPLAEAPRRLALMPSGSTLGVITSTCTPDGTELSFMRLFATPKIEAIGAYSFQPNESALSIACVSFPPHPGMYAVGTSLLEPDVDISRRGYIYLFAVNLNRGGLELVTRLEMQGAVQSLKPLGNRLVASVNGKVVLLTLAPHRDLIELSSSYGCVHVVDMDVSQGCVVVGDLMRSCQILQCEDDKLTEVARDMDMRWATAVHALDANTYLMADCHGNLVVLQRRIHEADAHLRYQLEVLGQYNLGDQVNRIVSGSLVLPPRITAGQAQPSGSLLSSAAGQTTTQDKEGSFPLEDILFQPSILGTVSGAVQLINPLPPRTFHLLRQLERNILHYLGGIGNVKHRVFRAFQDTKRTLEAKGFVDGDVIAMFLKLEPPAQLEILRGQSNQDRHTEFPSMLDVSAMAGASYEGLSHPPIQGQSRYKDGRRYPLDEKFRLVTGREAYDDDNRSDSHQPHPIPISHVALTHLLNDLTRLH